MISYEYTHGGTVGSGSRERVVVAWDGVGVPDITNTLNMWRRFAVACGYRVQTVEEAAILLEAESIGQVSSEDEYDDTVDAEEARVPLDEPRNLDAVSGYEVGRKEGRREAAEEVREIINSRYGQLANCTIEAIDRVCRDILNSDPVLTRSTEQETDG